MITISHKTNVTSEKSCNILNELIIHIVYPKYDYVYYVDAAVLACVGLSIGGCL